ncbi:MAG: hypothetical protein R3B13_06610 [Polyangiaceae bacterium]
MTRTSIPAGHAILGLAVTLVFASCGSERSENSGGSPSLDGSTSDGSTVDSGPDAGTDSEAGPIDSGAGDADASPILHRACTGITDLSGFVVAQEAGTATPDVTSHTVVSGAGPAQLTVGASNLGGGYVNQLIVGGIATGKDLSGPVSSLYGRGCQATLRDALHDGVFNPTQAGANRYAGTVRPITAVGGPAFGLTLPPRPAALMGPGGTTGYDFIQYEDLFADDFPNDGQNSDADGFDDPASAGQAGEVTSPFDFSGSLTNCKDVDLDGDGASDVAISCVRDRYRFAFVREGGDVMKQFGPGTPAWKDKLGAVDISVAAPSGVHPSTPENMAGLERAWSVRIDTDIWVPAHRFYLDATGALVGEARTNAQSDVFFKQTTFFDEKANVKLMADAALPVPKNVVAGSLVVLSDSTDPSLGVALGFYFPLVGVNRDSISAFDCAGSPKYTDARNVMSYVSDNPGRASGKMNLIAHKTTLVGILSPAETDADVYETVEGEVFILVGTPAEIAAAAKAIDQAL